MAPMVPYTTTVPSLRSLGRVGCLLLGVELVRDAPSCISQVVPAFCAAAFFRLHEKSTDLQSPVEPRTKMKPRISQVLPGGSLCQGRIL